MEQQEFVIERLTTYSPEIASALRDLAKQIGQNYQELGDEDLQEMLDSPFHFIFVAREKQTNQIAGMILVLVYRIAYVRKAYFDDLVIDEMFRGQGIGTLLIQKAIAFAKEKGAAYADCTSRPERGVGEKLYEKLGFQKRESNIYRYIYNYGKA